MKIIVTYTILHVILIPFQFSCRCSDRRYYQLMHGEVEEDNQKRIRLWVKYISMNDIHVNISTNSHFALLARLGRRKSS